MKSKKIPKLRFSEFNEEWQEKNLGELSSGSSYGMNSAATSYDGTNKYLRITDISSTTNDFLLNDLVSPSNKLDDKYLLKEGDILFARTGASVGKSYYYKKEDGVVYFAGFLIRFQIKDEFNYKFIFYNTLTNTYDNWVTATSMRSGQPGINETEYSEFKMFMPSKKEQDRIGNFFELLDQNLKTKEKEIKKMEELKKAYMQQIFNQEIRFKDENNQLYPSWEKKRIGEIADSFSGGTPSSSKKEYYSGTIPFIRSGEIKKRKTKLYISEQALSNSSAKMVEVGDLLIALYGATSGQVSISKINGAINQAVLCLRTTEDNLFIMYQWDFYKDQIINKYIQGGQGNLSGSLVKDVFLNFPILEEQKKIGKFLSLIDQKIELKNQELEKIKNHKKAFLQKMFI